MKKPGSSTGCYAKRAHHHTAILSARHALLNAPLDDSRAADIYDEAVAPYIDRADFAPYTAAYLDAHTDAFGILTAALDTLTVSFDSLAAAFVASNPTDKLYVSATKLYQVHLATYTLAAEAYADAAHCAVVAALTGNVQAAEDDFEVFLLEARAADPLIDDAVTAKAKAAAFKVKAAGDASKAKALQEKAAIAESQAKSYLAKASAAARG